MVLLVLSLISLIAAAGFAALAWFVVREDRRRSAVRVAALASAALDEHATSVLLPADTHDSTPEFLDSARPASMRGHPLVRVAVGFAMSVALIVFIAMSADRQDSRSGSATVATAAQQDGLELLSMRHQRDGETLSITGLVRNGGRQSSSGLTAVVFTFDAAGNFVASGRAPLEFGTLAPGDESPFSVTIPHVGTVARYRVSFRSATGIVRHVDRRTALQAAR
jgi:hypothetical protein